MVADTWIGLVIVFLLGAVTAHLDLLGWFRRKKIAVTRVFTHWAALLFLAGNGALGLALLLYLTEFSAAETSELVPSSSMIVNAVVIGLGVPALVRSRWFTWVGKGPQGEKTAAGFEAIYEWVRLAVLRRVHDDSILERGRIRMHYIERLQGNKLAVNELHEKVMEEVRPFRSKTQLADIEAEFNNAQRRFSQQLGSDKHLDEILRWAMDHTSVRFTERCLAAMVSA